MLKKLKTDNKGLNIIIVGCGKIGMTLTEKLSKEGNDITIIDKNQKRIDMVTGLYDVMGYAGNGASYSVLKEAGIDDADLLIAVTGSDELNLLCCTLAGRGGKCAKIARVRTPDYSEEAAYLREKLGLEMIINPEFEASTEAARLLYMPTALEIDRFAHGQAEMVKIKVPDNNIMIGRQIADICKKNNSVNVLICAVERDGNLTIPSGRFVIEKGDVISFIASRKNVREFMKLIGFKTNQVKDTMIVGGGKAAYYLAKQLLTMGISVKIIENDRNRAVELSELLPEAIIINADGTDEGILKEEGIEQTQSVVALTGIDEENIMLALHAKKVSDAKVITKINRTAFKSVISSMDLGSIINPRFITSQAIIAYVRAKKESMGSNIETLYHIFDSKAEAIEFRLDNTQGITDIPLMDLKLKDNLLIAIINRNGKIIIPSGNDCMRAGDSVVIVTTNTGLNDIKDILR
ncbi:MAG: Trk system potassium transporter TrkA [Lachnospira sp.]